MSEASHATNTIAVGEATADAPGARHDLTTYAASMHAQAMRTSSASDLIFQHIDAMNHRAATAAEACHDLHEELLAAAERLSASLKHNVQVCDAGTQHSLAKTANDYEAMAVLMDAGAAMGEGIHMSVQLMLASLASLDRVLHSMTVDGSRLCVPVSMLSPSALASMSTVWRELPDGTVSTVSGRGTKIFVKGAAGATRNLVLVYPRVSSGTLAEYVTSDDVCLMLRDDVGSLIDAHVNVEHVVDGGMQLAYAVSADCVSKLSVAVAICGVEIGNALTVQSGYDAVNGIQRVAAYDIAAGDTKGMTVCADGSMMAVSYDDPLNQVIVYQLVPSLKQLCVIGGDSTAPVEVRFQIPFRMCFAEDNTILVCDCYNDHVKQLTVAGEYVSSFEVLNPAAIAVYDDIVAVGVTDGFVELHYLSTGKLIRRFGSRGDKPGQIGGYAAGIRFTPTGSCLLVAEYSNSRLSLFTVDGVFMKHIGADVLGNGYKDASFAASGEIVVSDWYNHRMCVFSLDGDTLIKTWGSYGVAAGQFQFPKAIAVSGLRLYVMDSTTRVQVFE